MVSVNALPLIEFQQLNNFHFSL